MNINIEIGASFFNRRIIEYVDLYSSYTYKNMNKYITIAIAIRQSSIKLYFLKFSIPI